MSNKRGFKSGSDWNGKRHQANVNRGQETWKAMAAKQLLKEEEDKKKSGRRWKTLDPRVISSAKQADCEVCGLPFVAKTAATVCKDCRT